MAKMPSPIRKLRWVAWVTLLLAGAFQAWAFRHTVSPDGVAYLDLSDAILKGRPGDLVNGYWSPLYPAAVGVLRLVLAPTGLGQPYWEFALLHVASFLGFALSLAAFEWFLRELDAGGSDWGDTARPFASATGRALAYLFFGVASLGMISVAATTPDFFLSAAVLAAFACLLRLQRDPTNRAAANLLGLALGFGALTKSVAFPLAGVVLAALAFARWTRDGRAAVLRSAVVFLAVTAPWVIALSARSGEVTVGRTGSLNYAWYVGGQQPPNAGVMPPAAVARDLPLPGIAILDSARGTNPLWYDPARWHRDVRVRFSWSRQWDRVVHSVRYYVYVMAPLLCVVVAIAAGARLADVLLTLRRSLVILVPCLAALGAYAVTYTLSRLVAPFILAAFLALATAFPRSAPLRATPVGIAFALMLVVIQSASPPEVRATVRITYGMALWLVVWTALTTQKTLTRWLLSFGAVAALWALSLLPPPLLGPTALALVLGTLMLLVLRRAESVGTSPQTLRAAFCAAAVIAFAIPSFSFGFAAVRRLGAGTASVAHPEWSVAQRFIRDGVPAGSRIAVIGNPDNFGWARLAHYQIVAVIPSDQMENFARLGEAERARIMRRFAAVGATRLLAP